MRSQKSPAVFFKKPDVAKVPYIAKVPLQGILYDTLCVKSTHWFVLSQQTDVAVPMNESKQMGAMLPSP